MSIVSWNLKEAGYGEHTNPWANLRSNEQKSHQVISQNPHVHMEAMEETEDQGEEPAENGGTGRAGISGGD